MKISNNSVSKKSLNLATLKLSESMIKEKGSKTMSFQAYIQSTFYLSPNE